MIEKGEIYVLNEIARWLEIEELGEEEWGDLNIYNNNDYPTMNEDEEQFEVLAGYRLRCIPLLQDFLI